jgi:DNA topoisomerase-3
MSGVKGKIRKRVWIDSQTEEEILRGIREAKDLSEYDNLSDAAYLRAK